MTEVGGSNSNSGSMLPAHLLERLEVRDAQRRAAAASSDTTEARKRGEASGEHIILPPLNLLNSEEEEPIFASPAHNTPSFFLANMTRAKEMLLQRINRLEERCQVTEGAPELTERNKMLDDLLDQIEELQRWFSESSPHLKPFDVQQARRNVDDLKTRFQELRTSIMPKRRFKFGASVVKKPLTKSTAAENASIETNKSPKKPAATLQPAAGSSEFSLSGLSNRHDLRLPANDRESDKDCLRDQSLCLTDLTDCKVIITSSCGNLMASRLSKCLIKILRPVSSSVLLQDCVECQFVLACRQLRVHRTQGSRFDVFVASAPIIEDSSNLLVGPWNVGGDGCFSGVLGDKNHWNEVQDFSCPTLVAEKASESPNWSLLPMEEWLKS
nr:tubulin specific chaperone C [Hymenolepis microstoma]